VAVLRRGRTWLVTVELGRDPATGKRRRTYATVATKRDARREEARLRHQTATGLDLEPTKITVADYLHRWLAAVRPNLAPATFLRYEGLLRHQVMPHIGFNRLSKLRPLHIQQLYARLRTAGRADGEGGLSARTLLHVHRVLSETLSRAVRWQIVPRNVCKDVEAPHPRRAEMQALSPEEARRLLEAAQADNSVLGDAVIVGMHSGLRLGELLGLNWADVDFDQRRVTIRRTLQYLPRQGTVHREPKTVRGNRTVPLGATALSALRRLRRRQLEERLAVGPSYEDRGLVFTDPRGKSIPPYRLSQRFAGLVRRAGLPPMRFHDLRHTHATLLLARGVHPKVVSERLGHASIAITLDVYSHVLPTQQEEAARDLDAWLSGQAQ
jgi:integrase